MSDVDRLRQIARAWVNSLPAASTAGLADALRLGGLALRALRHTAVGPQTVAAIDRAMTLSDHDRRYVAGLLDGHVAAMASQSHVTPVWTGPTPDKTAHRLTIGVVADLITEAVSELVVVSYATHPSAGVVAALTEAGNRGVQITLLLERSMDNPAFHGPADPFPGLHATRLCWPAASRPTGASMHGKIIVVDRRVALVGSANLTGAALGSNLECGVLIRGGPVPAALASHLLGASELAEA